MICPICGHRPHPGFACNIPEPVGNGDSYTLCECPFEDRREPEPEPTLFDPVSLAEGERRRDEGIALVNGNASEDWKSAFETEGVRLLRQGRTRITAEDILAVVGLPPGHRNAVGAAMRGFAVKHNLRNIGTVKAARVARHAGRITVWERI